jgi:hypothetical protein
MGGGVGLKFSWRLSNAAGKSNAALERESALFRRLGYHNVHRMSLNRTEETLMVYLRSHAEERHYWEAKVREAMEKSKDDHASSASLARELWLYYEERCRCVPSLREAGVKEASARISMRNLAEFLMRVWGPIRARRHSAAGAEQEEFS